MTPRRPGWGATTPPPVRRTRARAACTAARAGGSGGRRHHTVRAWFYCDRGCNVRLGASVFTAFDGTLLRVAEMTLGDGTLVAPGMQILASAAPVRCRHAPGWSWGGRCTSGAASGWNTGAPRGQRHPPKVWACQKVFVGGCRNFGMEGLDRAPTLPIMAPRSGTVDPHALACGPALSALQRRKAAAQGSQAARLLPLPFLYFCSPENPP